MFNKICLVVLALSMGACGYKPVSNPPLKVPSALSVYRIFSLNIDFGDPFVFDGRAGGTAFLLKLPNGAVLVVTNSHVCEGILERGLMAITRSEADQKILVRPFKFRQAEADLCLLLAQSRGLDGQEPTLGKPYELATTPPKPGDYVTTLGYPRAGDLKMGRGTISSYSEAPDADGIVRRSGYATFQTYPGQSGSPIFNTDGRVVGVITAFTYQDGSAVFIPLETLVDFLKASPNGN